MRKPLVITVLLLVIALSFLFIALKIASVGEEDNYFNQNWRRSFAKHTALRQILSLDSYGDAKADYLEEKFTKILIEVDSLNGLRMSRQALDLLASRIQAVTAKETDYVLSNDDIPYQESVSQGELEDLAKNHRDFNSASDTASIYLLYVSADAESETQIGRTFREYGVVIYADTLRKFVSGSPKTLPNYEESTALHEFGHLLGLEHNEEPNCLMNEDAEIARFPQKNPDLVLTDFCPFELSLIRDS